jgi:hypothetical protein
MPEIEITEDQREYLEALRQDIQQDVVGKYAHVRMVDAVQYLIDNHEGEINATVTAPSAGPEVSAENAPVADPVSGDEEAEDPAEDDIEDGAEADDDDDAEADDAAEEAADDDAAEADEDEAADDEEDDEEAADSGGAASTPPMAAAGGGGDDDGMLSAMMALMDTHDDKWEEASGDTGYEVELPDGSTESANTQDDVRALLFKHYE